MEVSIQTEKKRKKKNLSKSQLAKPDEDFDQSDDAIK